MSGQDIDRGDSRIPPASLGWVWKGLQLLRPFVNLFTSTTGVRWICASCGVVALCALGFVGDGDHANHLAQFALVALGLATATGWWQLARSNRAPQRVQQRGANRSSHSWLLATLAVALLAGVAVQSWFQSGTSIATGDIAPPDGTAWLSRLFEPWVWAGSNLGEPSQLPLLVPWAAILGIVNALGGDPELAQRIWYTALVIGAGLGALAFMAALRMGPVAAFVGAVAYVLNPYVVSEVNIYANYLVALGLLAALPAVLLAVGARQLSVRWGALLIAAAAPLLGYVFLIPPLVGLIIGALVATPLFVAWVDGKEAASRSARALLIAVPLLLAASAYWIVAAAHHLSSIGGQLASLSSWTWTEGRATIRNGFWLNAIWSWQFPEYFPYAKSYDLPPVSVARFALPALAFSALGVGLGQTANGRNERSPRNRLLRIAVSAATVALLVVFLSTGTNPPGNVVFDRLYSLPFGWLIREPGRFLMVADLAYAALLAVAVEWLINNRSVVGFKWSRRLSTGAVSLLYVPLALGTSLLVGFPLYTGAVVTDSRPALPSAHVHVPTYWTEMAQFVDRLPVQGSVLVMPPDDFYQMPYTWGYYGSDGFVVDLFQRPVLVPNGQGYTPTSTEVTSAVNLTAQSILHHNWRQTEALVTALHTPLVLVRRDIVSSYPGRSILPPDGLVDALNIAPNFVLVRQIGSLDLFELRATLTEPEIDATFMTINSQAPDLRLLSLLPPGTAIISSQRLAGVPSIDQAPPLELWQPIGDSMVWRPTASGSGYRVADVNSQIVVSLDRSGAFTVGNPGARVVYMPNGGSNTITVSVNGRTAISNGDFTSGAWGPVGDCHAVSPTQEQAKLDAEVIPDAAPGGLPAMQLAASFDSACEYQPLNWHGGPLVVSLMVRHVQGAPPRVCVWEVGVNRCAPLPDVPNGSGWALYRALVTPDVATTALSIFLYADGPEQGNRTIDEYADLHVIEVPALPSIVLLASADGQPASPLRLVLLHNSYSTQWGSSDGKHVEVDGMLNGWLVGPGTGQFAASYLPSTMIRAAQWTSLASWLIALVISVSLMIWRLGAGRLVRDLRTRHRSTKP